MRYILIIAILFLIGCASHLDGKFDDGKLVGIEGKGSFDGGFEQAADGSTKAWMNSKTELIPSGLIEISGVKGGD